jgi:hypothetical protein
MKPKTLIVYEDNAADIEKAAHGMFLIAEKSVAPARIDAASSVTVAETLAADLLCSESRLPSLPRSRSLTGSSRASIWRVEGCLLPRPRLEGRRILEGFPEGYGYFSLLAGSRHHSSAAEAPRG